MKIKYSLYLVFFEEFFNFFFCFCLLYIWYSYKCVNICICKYVYKWLLKFNGVLIVNNVLFMIFLMKVKYGKWD